MAKSKVAIVRCESYDRNMVYEAVKRAISLIGGIEAIAKKNEKILLKVNNLAASNPDDAVTTHPALFEAMIKVLQEKKIAVSYGDSSGYGKPESNLKKSGFTGVADKYGIKLADFEGQEEIDFPKGVACKKFIIAKGCLAADGIISLPKMKTHMLTRITGAIKNQFGCVTGTHKASYHVKMPNPTKFSKMLVDLNCYLKPKMRLFVMDGIVAMEGNGPRGGNPINMNCIIISTDPIAVDSTFCRIIGVNPEIVPTIKYGQMSGLGSYEMEDIDYVGDPLTSFINVNFKANREPVSNDLIKSALPRALRNLFYAKPFIEPAKCVKCGVCVNACPVEGKALKFNDGDRKNPPVYDYSICIRCYCCQEMCPKKAISVKGHPQ